MILVFEEAAFTNWLDWATAIGTIGATVFAGWAAKASAASAKQTRDIVEIERRRDREAAEVAKTVQAKAVMVGMWTEGVFEDDLRVGADCRLTLTNASQHPIFKARLKMTVGYAVWGPQLVGDMAPGQEVEVYARLLTTDEQLNTDGHVRFADVRGEAWVRPARGGPEIDPTDVQVWIDEGARSRPTTAIERGVLNGVTHPDFDDFRDSAEAQG